MKVGQEYMNFGLYVVLFGLVFWEMARKSKDGGDWYPALYELVFFCSSCSVHD